MRWVVIQNEKSDGGLETQVPWEPPNYGKNKRKRNERCAERGKCYRVADFILVTPKLAYICGFSSWH